MAALAWLLGSHMFPTRGLQLRQYFGLGAMLAILFGSGLAGIVCFVEEVLITLPRRLVSIIAKLVVAIPLAISLFPSFLQSEALTYNFTLHDRRNDLAQYMDTSVAPGPYIASHDNHKTLNRSWGGYDGLHDFPRHAVNVSLNDKPVEEWRALGVEYAIMPHYLMLDDPDIYHPKETTLLKSFPPDPNFRGPDMVVLRLYPIQHPHDGRLGSIRLVGYDISATQLQAGDDLVFRHYWQAENPTDTPYHVYNHLLDATGEIVAQADYVPLWDSRRDTSTWDDSDEILLGREFTLSTPPDLAPGPYRLVSGFYDPVTWRRLANPDGSDSLKISDIEVRAY